METAKFLNLLNKKKLTIFAIVFLFLAITTVLTVIQPFKYLSSSKLLVIQNFSANTDPYTISKANEYLSNILAEVTQSNSFYNYVLESGFNIDKNYFGTTVKKQMKNWRNTVIARTLNDTGIIALDVYHKDKNQAGEINKAVAFTLQSKHGLYHGNAENVSIKVIDEPITGDFPAKPNIILNFSLAIILALIFSALYIYFYPDHKNKIAFRPKLNMPTAYHKMPKVHTEYESKNDWQAIKKFIEPYKEIGAQTNIKPDNLPDDLDNLNSYNFNENLIEKNYNKPKADNRVPDINEEAMYEEIVKSGDMKNIFGSNNPEGF